MRFERRQVRLGYWCLCGVGLLILGILLVFGLTSPSSSIAPLSKRMATAAGRPQSGTAHRGVAALSERRNDGGTPPLQLRLVEGYGKLPLSFEANAGQTDPQVKFLSRGRGYTLFLTAKEAVLALRNQKSAVRSQLSGSRQLAVLSGQRQSAPDAGPQTTDGLFPSLIQNPKSPSPQPAEPSPRSCPAEARRGESTRQSRRPR